MPLTRCLYFSLAVEHDGLSQDMGAIARDSLGGNARAALSSCLVRIGDHYIQCLEGRRAAVSERLLVLARDPRHTGMQLISWREVDRRLFPGWTLLLPSIHCVTMLVERYCSDHVFNPRDYRAETFEQLFAELAGLHPFSRADALVEWAA